MKFFFFFTIDLTEVNLHSNQNNSRKGIVQCSFIIKNRLFCFFLDNPAESVNTRAIKLLTNIILQQSSPTTFSPSAPHEAMTSEQSA